MTIVVTDAQKPAEAHPEKLLQTPSAAQRPSLLDQVLPSYAFAGRYETLVYAPASDVFKALQEVTLADMPLAYTIGSLRYLPGRLLGQTSTDPAASARPFLSPDQFPFLAETPGREIVTGTIGRLHDLVDQQFVSITTLDDFNTFYDPDYQKLAISMRVEGDDPIAGERLIAEHRTQPLGPSARWKFSLYWWLLVRHGSAFMCKLLFDAVKRRAERGADPHPFKSLGGRANYFAAYEAALRKWPVAYESRIVQTSFGSTHVLVSGPASGPPLVLLHGFCMSGTMWLPNVAEWSRAHRVYALDTIGDIGRSVATRPLKTQAEYVAWYGEVLDGLGIQNADVLGLSYGGWIALSVAVHAPERVKRLIVCDPAASFAPLSKQFWLRVAPSLVMPVRQVTSFHLRWFLMPGSVAMPELEEQWIQGWKHFDQAGSAFPTVFSDAELRALSAPTLLLIGEHDVIYGDRDAVIGRAQRLVPSIEAEFVPDACHVPSVEQPAWTNARVLRFLDAAVV